MAHLTIPAWLQQVFDSLPINIFCRDPQGHYLFCNRYFAERAGTLHTTEVVGKTDNDFPWGNAYTEEDRRLLAERRPLISQLGRRGGADGEHWCKTHKIPFYDEDGTPLGVIGIIEDLDYLKGLEDAFSAHQQLLRRLLDTIPDLIFLARPDGSLLEYNQALLDFLGLKRGDADLQRPGCAPEHLQDLIDNTEQTLCDARGIRHLMAVTRLAVPDLHEPATLTLCRDITGLRSTQLQLHRARHVDSLTGLLKLSTFLEQAQQRQQESYCLLMLDLQHFREINDRFGIRVADQLLMQVASRLRDHAPAGALLCRVAADDFCLLVPLAQLDDALHNWCQRLCSAIATPYMVGEHRIQIDCHLGVAEGHNRDAERLLGHAEAALAQAKEGRSPFHFFDPVLAAYIQRRRTLEQALPQAILRDQLHLVYQAIMYAGSHRLHGAEVLCRWHHEELGPIPPDEFIPLAEYLGLISQLGMQVTRRASHQLAAWLACAPDLTLSVNLSPLQFRHPDLCRDLLQITREAGIDPAHLELEITETVLMENAEEINSNLRQLLANGFPLAIDDFGTGYCSLAYLPRIPVHNLKLDRSFIKELGRDSATTAIVRSVIGLAQELGIQITAEGVETEAQCDWLTTAGCQRLQGYLFSKPLPPEIFSQHFLPTR